MGFVPNSLHMLKLKSCSTELVEEVEGSAIDEFWQTKLKEEVEGPGDDVILTLILVGFLGGHFEVGGGGGVKLPPCLKPVRIMP